MLVDELSKNAAPKGSIDAVNLADEKLSSLTPCFMHLDPKDIGFTNTEKKTSGKKSDEDELPTWWTNKLAVSAHNMNAARDYITDNIKEDLDEAMSPEQIKRLKDSWSDIKLMSPEKVKSLKNFLDKYSTDTLMQLSQSGINFVSNMARSVAMRRKTGDMKHAGSMKEETKTPQQKVQDLQAF